MPLAPKIIAQQATENQVLLPMSKEAERYWRDMYDLFGMNVPIPHTELKKHVLPRYKRVDSLLAIVRELEAHKKVKTDWSKSTEKLKKVTFTIIEAPEPEVFGYIEGLAELVTRFVTFTKEDGAESNPTLYYGNDYHITVYRWRTGYSFMINRKSDNMKRGGNKAFPTIEEAKLRACRVFLTEILFNQENDNADCTKSTSTHR